MINVKSIFNESIDLRAAILKDDEFIRNIEIAAAQLIKTVEQGGTVYTCGNGGSACDAIHFCEELIARYKKDRPGMKAQHFMDPGVITCWANDYSYATLFERQAATFCGPNDTLVIFSTSGLSENVLRAATAAKKNGAFVLSLLGKGGGKLPPLSDLSLIVPSNATERIQEIHITLVHIFCEFLESKY